MDRKHFKWERGNKVTTIWIVTLPIVGILKCIRYCRIKPGKWQAPALPPPPFNVGSLSQRAPLESHLTTIQLDFPICIMSKSWNSETLTFSIATILVCCPIRLGIIDTFIHFYLELLMQIFCRYLPNNTLQYPLNFVLSLWVWVFKAFASLVPKKGNQCLLA